MLSRVQKIMEDKGLTPTSLADEIGVQRSRMSHVLSGRNNPSLDIVMLILDRFKDIETDWLVFGHEPMYKTTTPIQQGLFDKEATGTIIEKRESEPVSQRTAIAVKQSVQQHVPLSVNQLSIKQESNRKITKIMVFYSDSSFETFVPENLPIK